MNIPQHNVDSIIMATHGGQEYSVDSGSVALKVLIEGNTRLLSSGCRVSSRPGIIFWFKVRSQARKIDRFYSLDILVLSEGRIDYTEITAHISCLINLVFR